MADNKIAKLGGTDLGDEKGKPSQWNNTFNAVLKAVANNTAFGAIYACESSNYVATSLGASDLYTSAAGVQSTVDTGNTTMQYCSVQGLYVLPIGALEASGDSTSDPDSFTTPSNAFDGNDSTYAEKTYTGNQDLQEDQLGKTFASQYVGLVRVKAAASSTIASSGFYIKILTYNGSTWDDNNIFLVPSTTGTSVSFDGYYFLNTTCQGVAVEFAIDAPSAGNYSMKLYTLDYSSVFTTSGVIETNSLFTAASAPDSVYNYVHAVTTSNHTITCDISDDGGTTFDVTSQSGNDIIPTTALTGTNIAAKWTFSTASSADTPIIYGHYVGVTS